MNYVCKVIALTLSFWQKKRPKKTVFVQPVSVFRVRGLVIDNTNYAIQSGVGVAWISNLARPNVDLSTNH